MMMTGNPVPHRKLANTLFSTLCVLHVFIWTLLPATLRYALPMDSLEGAVWGQHLDWGYDRNPWMNAWLTHFALNLSQGQDWLVYLFSQLFVVAGLLAVYRLGRKWLLPLQALLAVIVLEVIQYYSLAAVDFNDNVIELGLWPLITLFFYRALMQQKIRDWIIVGIFSALALMTKYYAVIFLITLLLFLIVNKQARLSFKSAGLYISFIVFICLVLPHVIWLYQHEFITVQYAFNRVSDNQAFNLWQYIMPSLRFGLLQLINLAIALIVLSFVFIGLPRQMLIEISEFDRSFILFTATGTFIITILLGLITGWQLHTLWGMPLLSLAGLLAVTLLKPVVTPKKLCQVLVPVVLIFAAYAIGYSYAMTKPNSDSSGNFPAKNFAENIENIWQSRYQKPLAYVAGNRYLAGYVLHYGKEKPQVFIDWDPVKSPGIDIDQMKKSGAIFLWLESDGKDFPSEVYQKYPNLINLGVMQVERHRSNKPQNTVDVLVGILPPG